MVTSQECLTKFGQPGSKQEGRWMALWDVPDDLEQSFAHCKFFPGRLYCNRALVAPLEQALRQLIARGLASELVEWGGCYNFRARRGWGIGCSVKQAVLSPQKLHSPSSTRSLLELCLG